MTITVMNDYLVFPVYTYATEKKLTFQCEGETVYELNLKLDHAAPNFYAYIDVSRFKGKDLELSVTPEMEISCRETDEIDADNLYRESNRPQIHFTVKNGFFGNPLGLAESDGAYHLFYQYNPADIECGNLHLGHATSKDLIHWQEEKNAAFPDEKGIFDCESVMKDYGIDGSAQFVLTDPDGNQKWILMDEAGKYSVGYIENGRFLSEQDVQILQYGTDSGRCVSVLTDGRVVQLERTPWEAPCFCFCGQMGIPTELSLVKENGVYYVQSLPVEEIACLYKNTNRYENLNIEKSIEIPLADAAHLIRMKGNFAEDAVLDITLFGRRIRIDFSQNQISVGQGKAPVSITKKGLDLTLLVDRCGVELFADGGKICFSSLSAQTMMDRNLLQLALNCNTEYTLDSLEFHALEPIWQTSPKRF